jgi:hypothetical protein
MSLVVLELALITHIGAVDVLAESMLVVIPPWTWAQKRKKERKKGRKSP